MKATRFCFRNINNEFSSTATDYNSQGGTTTDLSLPHLPLCTFGPGVPAAFGYRAKVLTLLTATTQMPGDLFIEDT